MTDPKRWAGLDIDTHVAANDSYHFFETVGTLCQTDPTNTHACDLQIVLIMQRNYPK